MKHLFSQIMIALALMCGAIFVASVFVACLSDDINVIRIGCLMSWVSSGFGFLFAVFGTDLSD